MNLTIYQIDAFCNRVFSGNPAAVCPLEEWIDDDIMQKIAAENNLSETAFFVKENDGYHIRWFTPTSEVELCGHATLAAAHVIFKYLNYPESTIRFKSLSGSLSVSRNGKMLSLDFPSYEARQFNIPPDLSSAFNIQPAEILLGNYYLVIFRSEADVRNIEVDFAKLLKLDNGGVVVTGPGKDIDFVSRFFAPKFGINEDPVTGSAHCVLTPYWSKRLAKKTLNARQISERGGELVCMLAGDRVHIAGQVAEYLTGTIKI